MGPSSRSTFQPLRPMYGMTLAWSGYRAIHSSASSRVAPPLTPSVAAPRKAKIFAPTFATWSPSHGWSAQAPGLSRQYARMRSASTTRSCTRRRPRSPPDVGGTLVEREPRGRPGFDPADDVGRAPEAERAQARGGQARAVALPAQHDDVPVVVRRLRDGRVAGRVEPPLQHRPVDDERARDLALRGPLPLGAGVDEQSFVAGRVPRLVRRQPPD